MDRGSCFFYALEKTRGAKKHITCLLAEDGIPLTEPVEMRLTGLVLQEPELRLILLVYADDMLLVVQDSGDLAQVEACQATYSAASFARVNWVKSSGLVVGDWRQASSLPPSLQTIQWSAGPLLYLCVYLSATHPSPPENWQNLEGGVIERVRKWTGLF
ncbi:unnamed protein product [Caretta caretta]